MRFMEKFCPNQRSMLYMMPQLVCFYSRIIDDFLWHVARSLDWKPCSISHSQCPSSCLWWPFSHSATLCTISRARAYKNIPTHHLVRDWNMVDSRECLVKQISEVKGVVSDEWPFTHSSSLVCRNAYSCLFCMLLYSCIG